MGGVLAAPSSPRRRPRAVLSQGSRERAGSSPPATLPGPPLPGRRLTMTPRGFRSTTLPFLGPLVLSAVVVVLPAPAQTDKPAAAPPAAPAENPPAPDDEPTTFGPRPVPFQSPAGDKVLSVAFSP